MTDDDYGYVPGSVEPSRDLGDDPGSRMWLLGLSGAAILTSVVLLPFAGLGLHVVGYVFASLVASTLVALFRRASVARFLIVSIGTARGTNAVAGILLAAGLLVSVLHAYSIAKHFA